MDVVLAKSSRTNETIYVISHAGETRFFDRHGDEIEKCPYRPLNTLAGLPQWEPRQRPVVTTPEPVVVTTPEPVVEVVTTPEPAVVTTLEPVVEVVTTPEPVRTTPEPFRRRR